MTEKAASRPEAVVVALSGGVDSSVAAAVLREQGWKVSGVTLDLFSGREGEGKEEEGCGGKADGRSCGGGAAAREAARVAADLGIPHAVVNLRRRFDRTVVADFVAEYARGRTPNPCVRCNWFVKFGPLLGRAKRLGAAKIATGHYARVDFDGKSGRWRLLKGVDTGKDQSYFLYALPQEALARTIFPLGGMKKTEVRDLAARFRLHVARKSESQEICFIPGDDYAAFLRGRIPGAFRPGHIVDGKGKIIGCHQGFLNYTIGQRKGMGIAAPRPLYVLALDAAANTIVAGPDEALLKSRFAVAGVNWVAIAGIDGPRAADVKIRSRHEGEPATLFPGPRKSVIVEFARPQRAITPGQAAVFYEGDAVLGGGTISRVLNNSEPV